MKKISLVILLLTSVLISNAASANRENVDKKVFCFTISVGGWVGVGGPFGGGSITVTVANLKICCHDNGDFGVDCGMEIINNANHDNPYSYGGVNMIPSWAALHVEDYEDLVKQMQDAIACSDLSQEDKDAANNAPLVLHVEMSTEGSGSETLPNQIIVMPGTYTLASDGGITVDVGVVQ